MKINIESILNKHLGKSVYTGGESTMNSTRIKAHNPRRLALAEAFIYADKLHYAKNRAEQVVLIKTYGEASDVVKKIKNKATDVWRIVKALLGKLMVVIEEQISKIFDNTNKLVKVADNIGSLVNQYMKISSNSGSTIDEELANEEIEFLLPNSLVGKNEVSGPKTALNSLDNIRRAIDHQKALAKDKNEVAKMFAVLKSNKKDLKAVIKRAKNVKETDLKDYNLTAGITNVAGSSAQSLKNFDTFIDYAASQEVLAYELKNNKIDKKYALKNNLTRYTITQKENIHEFYKFSEVVVKTLEGHIKLAIIAREFNFAFKKEANKLKNLPTTYTERLKKEQLERMRVIISRATKSVGIIYKTINFETAINIKEAKYLYDVLKQFNEIIKRELEEADSTEFTPKYKNTQTP